MVNKLNAPYLFRAWKDTQGANELISFDDWIIEFTARRNIIFSCNDAAKIIYLKEMLKRVGGMPIPTEKNELKNEIILALYSLTVADNDTYANRFIAGKRANS
jgi:hypothetical protein